MVKFGRSQRSDRSSRRKTHAPGASISLPGSHHSAELLATVEKVIRVVVKVDGELVPRPAQTDSVASAHDPGSVVLADGVDDDTAADSDDSSFLQLNNESQNKRLKLYQNRSSLAVREKQLMSAELKEARAQAGREKEMMDSELKKLRDENAILKTELGKSESKIEQLEKANENLEKKGTRVLNQKKKAEVSLVRKKKETDNAVAEKRKAEELLDTRTKRFTRSCSRMEKKHGELKKREQGLKSNLAEVEVVNREQLKETCESVAISLEAQFRFSLAEHTKWVLGKSQCKKGEKNKQTQKNKV